MYEKSLRDPASVGEEWRQLFDNGKVAELPVIPTNREEVLSGGGMRDAGSVAAPEQPHPASPIPHPGLTPITGPAARLVQNMTDSLSVPTATSFREITVDVLDARRRALDAQLAAATITLTNPGTIGTVASVPRLMKGQGSIIATGAIRTIGGAKVMTITSTYDHRVIQGAESGVFLRRLDDLLHGEENFYDAVFESLGVGAGSGEQGAVRAAALPAPSSRLPAPDELKHVAAAMALVKAIRNFGHLAARLDPLGSEPPGDPALDPGPLGLTPEIMARIPADLLRIYVPGRTLAEAYPKLQETYCGTIAYEVEHIGSHQERVWLRQVIESGDHKTPLPPEAKRKLLARLTAVETLERFLHKAYLGQKRFSIEGLDTLVPMLDQTIELARAGGAPRGGL